MIRRDTSPTPAPTRRTLLAAGTAAATATLVAAPAHASDGLSGRFRALEKRYGARLGVYAHDPRSGRTVRYRADTLFPQCSLFKTLAAAAVLRDLDPHREVHTRPQSQKQAALVEGGSIINNNQAQK
ncbi:serine hydrolase, partial [Streptomyces sp. NPDC059515]|uniref:serine hydrolase n=1 Tax=Streptomyces sp. NPDC059515 TaxID=3346854 RepID=UPI0036B73121